MSKIYRQFEQCFQDNFDQVFIEACDGQEFTYGQVWALAQSIAADWESEGLKPGEAIALILPNHPAFLCSYLACMIGGYLACPMVDTLLPKDIDRVLAVTKPKMIIRELPHLETNIDLPERQDIKLQRDKNALFGVFFTSGTTGEPKGICQRLEGVLGSAASFARHCGMDQNTRLYHIMPMAYMAGLLNTFLCTLMAGGTLIEGPKFSPESMLTFWLRPAKLKVNMLVLTPSIAAALCRVNRNTEKSIEAAKHLHLIQSTGGVLHRGLRQRFLKNFGKPLCDCMGITEFGGPFTIQTPEDALLGETSGPLLPEVEWSLRPHPDGGQELWIKSPFIMRGYIHGDSYQLPVDGDGYMATGDLAKLENGNLVLTGRCKDLIVRGAVNISPISIENVISTVEDVKDVAVIGISDDFWGEIVVACLISQDGCDADATKAAVDRVCRDHISQIYWPDKIVTMDDFPRSLVGKVQKKALKQLALPLLDL